MTLAPVRRRSACHLAVSSDSGIIVFHEFGLSHGWRDAVGPQYSPDVGGSDWIRYCPKLAFIAEQLKEAPDFLAQEIEKKAFPPFFFPGRVDIFDVSFNL